MKRVPAFRLIPEPLTPEAAALTPNPYADPVIGARHRIGGEPPVPEQQFPRCPMCGEAMSFYGQLDSLNNVEFDIADAGLVAVLSVSTVSKPRLRL